MITLQDLREEVSSYGEGLLFTDQELLELLVKCHTEITVAGKKAAISILRPILHDRANQRIIREVACERNKD